MLMGSKSHKDISGIDFLVDSRGRRKAVLIDLEKHGPLWEDLYDAYVAQQRRNEPRESLAAVKKLLQSPARCRAPDTGSFWTPAPGTCCKRGY
jgi:hypothetical protein